MSTTKAQDIPQRAEKTESNVLSVSTSPTATRSGKSFESFPGSLPHHMRIAGTAKPLKPFDSQDIKILLLENVNQTGKDILTGQGYQVESLKTSLPEDQLIEKIRYAHAN